jgi:hypothetical protein
MSIISDIKSDIQSQLATFLGVSYKLLPFSEDVAKNNWNQVVDGYAVRDVSNSEISGVNRAYTMALITEIVLTGRYNDGSISDERLIDVKDDLVGKALDIYKLMINTKAGSPSNVMQVNGLVIPEIENDEESKILVQRIQFNVIYRIQL